MYGLKESNMIGGSTPASMAPEEQTIQTILSSRPSIRNRFVNALPSADTIDNIRTKGVNKTAGMLNTPFSRFAISFSLFFLMYRILISAFVFFDIDVVYSNTYIVWMFVLTMLYSFLPANESYIDYGDDLKKRRDTTKWAVLYYVMVFTILVLTPMQMLMAY
jgi:hypothetical protein